MPYTLYFIHKIVKNGHFGIKDKVFIKKRTIKNQTQKRSNHHPQIQKTYRS